MHTRILCILFGLYTYCRMMHGVYKNFVRLVGLYTYCRMMHGVYKNFVHLVGLYTHCRMIHGAYNVKNYCYLQRIYKFEKGKCSFSHFRTFNTPFSPGENYKYDSESGLC